MHEIFLVPPASVAASSGFLVAREVKPRYLSVEATVFIESRIISPLRRTCKLPRSVPNFVFCDVDGNCYAVAGERDYDQ